MTRKSLEGGLRRATERRRFVDEHTDRIASAAQAHAEALDGRRQWCLRRIEQALAKAADKPVAAAGLERLRVRAEKHALKHNEFLFLLVIENRLAKGEDIADQEPRPRPFVQSKRPEWMRDPALLPRKPPGR